MKLSFHGAAREVTGSCHLIRFRDARILFDCGLHQGGSEASRLNRRPFPFDVARLNAVVLSHAHVDHVGRLPLLVKRGYLGPIYATPATIALTEILLKDSAHVQEMDAQRKTRKRLRSGRLPIDPLYTLPDVERVLPLLKPVEYGRDFEVVPDAVFRYHDAGHILGSAITEFELGRGGAKHRLVMSGDIGHRDSPLLRDPATLTLADSVVMESTYGDRDHRDPVSTLNEFESILREAKATGGKVIVPAFAVGRTQSLIYHIAELDRAGRLPIRAVYVDSPMAWSATELYCRHERILDEATLQLIEDGFRLCKLEYVRFTRSAAESMALNRLAGPAVIISASGMCTGGRILHHLRHNLWRPEAHVVFVGFQPIGSLGRLIVDGAGAVRIFGERVVVKAKVHTVGGFSAHAGRSELIAWHDAFTASNPNTTLVHGERRAMDALADAIEKRRGKRPRCPVLDEEIDLVPNG